MSSPCREFEYRNFRSRPIYIAAMDATLVSTNHIPLLIKYFKRSKVKWFD